MPEHVSQKLIENKDKLVAEFLEDRDMNFSERLTYVFDEYFSESYENSIVGADIGMSDNPYAIVALGGYGRKEQCIFSDIDLLFLFKKNVPKQAEELIKEVVYPLWDAGFEVGHSTRSIKECVRMAGDDLEILMSLLDGRFICGMSSFYIEMIEELRKKVLRFNSKKIISLLVQDNHERHKRYGSSLYKLEPNLKEGQGGLRDYHNMLWIARVKFGLREPKDLEYSGYISEREYSEVTEAITYIRLVRNLLHYYTGRKCDQLYLEHQKKIARLMRFEKMNGSDPVEKFLAELHRHMELLKEQHNIFLFEMGFEKKIRFTKNILGKKTNVKGLVVTKKESLDFLSLESVLENPGLLMRVFDERAKLMIPLSVSAKRVIRELSYLVDDDFRKDKKYLRIFENILTNKSVDISVLFEMKSTEFLENYIPEFKAITNFIQYNSYHIYPADIHSLKTAEVAKGFGDTEHKEALYFEIYNELKDKNILMWACLLHDIGKGPSPDHHSEAGAGVAKKVLKRFGYSTEQIETVQFLIREHLLLIQIATRRDINDEETVIYCARKVKDAERLKMLYLLTVADAIATGEKAWGDWNSSLLRDLFFKVLKMLKVGELATLEITDSVKKKRRALKSRLLESVDEEQAIAYLDILPPRYLAYVKADDILNHFSIYNNLSDCDFVWNVRKNPSVNSRIVTICAKNQPGFFSKVAGTFTLSDIDILDAQIYTWKDNTILDMFYVTPPADQIFEDESWEKIKNKFQKAITGELDLSEQISKKPVSLKPEKIDSLKKPLKVKIDNESSSFFTIIEVTTFDFPGLLFRITDALFKCELDIQVAKVATKVDQVMDIFYVRNFLGEKVDTEEDVHRITSAIDKVIPDCYK